MYDKRWDKRDKIEGKRSEIEKWEKICINKMERYEIYATTNRQGSKA